MIFKVLSNPSHSIVLQCYTIIIMLVLISGTVITLSRQAALLGAARMFPFLHTWVTESIRRQSAEGSGATPELRASSSLSLPLHISFVLNPDQTSALIRGTIYQPNSPAVILQTTNIEVATISQISFSFHDCLLLLQ